MKKTAILYAEDEANDILFLELALEKAGSPHALHSVADGEQAIEYLSGLGPYVDRTQHPLPDLVLLDINMPRVSGLEVLEWIRQKSRFKSLPVVILTSSSRPEDREKARQLDVDDYLLKPSDPRKLVEIVKSLQDRLLSKRTVAKRSDRRS